MGVFPMNPIALRKLKQATVGIKLNKSKDGKQKKEKKPNSKSLITGESNDSGLLQPHADDLTKNEQVDEEWVPFCFAA